MVRVLTTGRRALLAVAALTMIASSASAGDPAKGRAVFASQCSICHSNNRNGQVIVGPPLYGVIGRTAGTVSGFDYSKTMKSAGFVWAPDRLRSYLPAPRDYLPGVKMSYAGLKNPNQLEDLISYLQTLK